MSSTENAIVFYRFVSRAFLSRCLKIKVVGSKADMVTLIMTAFEIVQTIYSQSAC